MDVRSSSSRVVCQRCPDRNFIIKGSPVWVHEGRRVVQPDVCGYEIEGRRLVVKDFRRRPWLVRRWWGRWILRREWVRLERLQGIVGIPRLLGWVDGEAFAMEWIAGERLPHLRSGSLEPAFFDRLAQLVGEMHARGVSHGDLRRKNILADREGRPYLIDFATAFLVGPSRRSQRLFRSLCEIDCLTLLKLKSHYCSDSLTDEERRCLEEQPLVLRFGRFLRKRIYRPFKPRHIRRRWEKIREFLFGQRPERRDPPDR